jgi:hypothetical protein
MYQVIIILGILLALVGACAIAAGAPAWALGLGLGSSRIQSGSVLCCAHCGISRTASIWFHPAPSLLVPPLPRRQAARWRGANRPRLAASLHWDLSAKIRTMRHLWRKRTMARSRNVRAAAPGLR